MKYPLRILTINLCDENPGNKKILINKWIIILSKLKIDILFIQEINNYNVEKILCGLGMKILNINNLEGTCVLINPLKLGIIDNNCVKIQSCSKQIHISGIHLDDVPSLSHIMNNVVYNSTETIPLSYSMQKLLKLCSKRRLPKIQDVLKNIENKHRYIIAGDFNEPSHLDLKNIKTPVSIELEKNGFVDSYRFMNKGSVGYTWPSGNFYRNEPSQRTDFIYTKNIKIVGSSIYDNNNSYKWASDHKILITDIVI